MFISKEEKALINDVLGLLTENVEEIKKRLESLNVAVTSQNYRLVSLENAAYGLKKDGTPRAKPGRKAK